MENNQTPQVEIIGILTTKQEVGNMKVEHLHIANAAIEMMLKSVSLKLEVQETVMDRLVDRTPEWPSLTDEAQLNKIRTALIEETVVEYLRLFSYIREDVDMLEIGLDEEESMIVSAFYIDKNELTGKVIPSMSEDEVAEIETQMNIFNSQVDLVEEAKKKMEKTGQVIPFMNREQRRAAKMAKSQNKKSHK